jgi:hypothetical protein
MLAKTFIGYSVGFFISYFLWEYLIKVFKKGLFVCEKKKTFWRFIQWMSSGLLWVAWLTNNTSNVAVFVPREFTLWGLILFLIIGVTMIAFVFYNRGGPIQEIVTNKNGMNNLKSTSITNVCFALIILGIARVTPIPMATTWIFIGILAGQEMALQSIESQKILTLKEKYHRSHDTINKDLILAGSGIIVSLIFALIKNLSV